MQKDEVQPEKTNATVEKPGSSQLKGRKPGRQLCRGRGVWVITSLRQRRGAKTVLKARREKSRQNSTTKAKAKRGAAEKYHYSNDVVTRAVNT